MHVSDSEVHALVCLPIWQAMGLAVRVQALELVDSGPPHVVS